MSIDFNITEGTVPEQVSSREKAPNPFRDKFPTKRDDEGNPVGALVVELPSSTEEEKANVKAVVGMAQRAAREKGFTGRVKRETCVIETVVPGRKTPKQVEGTRLTIWTIDKITQNRKPKGDAAAAPKGDA